MDNGEVLHLVIVMTAMLAAATFQAAIGFGFGLIAVFVLSIAGFELRTIVLVTSICCCMQVLPLAISNRKEISWHKYYRLFVILGISTIAGTLLLKVSTWLMPTNRIKLIFACCILLAVTIQLCSGRISAAFAGIRWGYLAVVVGGVMGGIAATPGPPIAIWATSQDWRSTDQRVFLWTAFAISYPIIITILIASDFESAKLPIFWSVAAFPAIWFGTQLGGVCARTLSDKHLYWISMFALIVGAVASLLRI